VKLSIVVPAHDEQALVGGTVRAAIHACEAVGEAFEVVVVDDASADGTGEVANAAGARVVRIEARHIAAARNAGAAAAHGEVLVFVDADTTIVPEVLRAALRAIADGAAGGGAAVRFDEPVPRWVHLLLPVALFINERLRVAAGCFMFCTRGAFDAVGGFDERLFAAEETFFSRSVGRVGPFRVLRETVTTSGRKLRAYSGGEILRIVARLVLLGRRGLRDRRHLGLWYGERRGDPASVG